MENAVYIACCQDYETDCDENKGQIEKQVLSFSCEIVELERKVAEKKSDQSRKKIHHRAEFVKPHRDDYSHTFLFVHSA
jgi:hypothetical protein